MNEKLVRTIVDFVREGMAAIVFALMLYETRNMNTLGKPCYRITCAIVVLFLTGCAATQPWVVTAADEQEGTLTLTCFYSKHLHCRARLDYDRANEATDLCVKWGYNDLLIRGPRRHIENAWGIGGRIERDFECVEVIAIGS